MNNFSRDGAANYLAAMIDGEGTVSFSPERGKRIIAVDNTDFELIEACATACDMFSIRYHITDTKPKESHHKWQKRLMICDQASLSTVAREIPLRSERKKELLDQMLSSYIRQPYNLAAA